MRRLKDWLRAEVEVERWFVIVTFGYIVITMADNHEWWALGVFAGAMAISFAVGIYVTWRKRTSTIDESDLLETCPAPRDPTKPSN